MKAENGVSVIICSYNGENIITETLNHLMKQQIPDTLNWEVLLVDNRSTDNTAQIAKKHWEDGSCEAPMRILEQPVPGKIQALKKGIIHAQYEFILICDDDNFLDEHYLETAYDIITNNNQIGLLGGFGTAVTEGVLPEWFSRYKEYYGCGRQTDVKEELTDITYGQGYAYGAGSVFRRSIFYNILDDMHFRNLSGRKGNNLVGAEDNIMSYLAAIKGHKIWYSDQLKFSHKITKDRLKWDYLLNLSYSNGKSQIHLEPYADFKNNKVQLSNLGSKIWKNVKHILSLLRKNKFNLLTYQAGSLPQVNFYYYLGKLSSLLKMNYSYHSEYQETIRSCEKLIEHSESYKS